MHRTTNVVMGYHSILQRIIIANHVNISRFKAHIKDTQQSSNDVEQTILLIRDGNTRIRHPINRRYVTNLTRVEDIVKNYGQYKNDETMDVNLQAICNY